MGRASIVQEIRVMRFGGTNRAVNQCATYIGHFYLLSTPMAGEWRATERTIAPGRRLRVQTTASA
jgi:hypothetical protein